MSDTLGQMIPALVIFVGGPLLIWWLKRRRPTAGGGLRVSARTALTRNSVIAVIELDDKRLLIGATDNGITLLSELAADSPSQTAPQPSLPHDLEAGQDARNTEDAVRNEPAGPRTSPLEQLRVMTTRRVNRPRPPRVHR